MRLFATVDSAKNGGEASCDLVAREMTPGASKKYREKVRNKERKRIRTKNSKCFTCFIHNRMEERIKKEGMNDANA